MCKRLLSALALVVVLAGCNGQQADEGGGSAASAQTPSDGITVASSRKCPGTPDYHWAADFKLPLEIHIDLPEPPPPEITGPSPPIADEKGKPAAK